MATTVHGSTKSHPSYSRVCPSTPRITVARTNWHLVRMTSPLAHCEDLIWPQGLSPAAARIGALRHLAPPPSSGTCSATPPPPNAAHRRPPPPRCGSAPTWTTSTPSKGVPAHDTDDRVPAQHAARGGGGPPLLAELRAARSARRKRRWGYAVGGVAAAAALGVGVVLAPGLGGDQPSPQPADRPGDPVSRGWVLAEDGTPPEYADGLRLVNA